MANAQRGQVTVKNDGKDNLILQLPTIYSKRYFGIKQKYISFGAKDTPLNRHEANGAALKLQSDIESDNFAPLDTIKYKHSNQRLGDYKHIENINVVSLFDNFVNSLIIEPTTYRNTYKTARNHLQKMISKHNYILKQQSEIDVWLRANVAESFALEMLAILYRMIEWGKRELKVSKDFPNNFKQYEQNFKKSLRGQRTKRKPPIAVSYLPVKQGIQAHSEECRDKIIKAFHNRKRQKGHEHEVDLVAHLIEFLFLTGCRHGEAFALTWKDIEYGKNNAGMIQVKININKSYSGVLNLTKNTKTRKHRKVPVTDRVVKILEILKSEQADPNLLIFRNQNNKHFTTQILRGYWAPNPEDSNKKRSVISGLIEAGEIDYYMDPYSTRRTFVSIQLNKGVPVNTVAMWVGDNPETILKHYGRPDDDAVPY